MTVELQSCPCGCGLQLLPEDYDKAAAAIAAAVSAGRPAPRHLADGTVAAPGEPVQVAQPEPAEAAPFIGNDHHLVSYDENLRRALAPRW